MLTQEKKEQLVVDSELWWEHKLERPIIQVVLAGKTNKVLPTRGEQLALMYDYDIPAKEVAKKIRDVYESLTYLGDAFPGYYMRSTGVLGAMLGQTYSIDVKHGTIWFEQMTGKELVDIQPKLTEDNQLFKRALELIEAFQEEFGDEIAYGIPNLGGVIDIVESMRGANNSLMDLYDDPEEVLRLNDDIYNAYEFAYNKYMDVISKKPKLGYSGWTPLLSQKPYFISQCDFCCMIGPDQFKEFVFDTLTKEANLIERSFYHLDGPGAVKHLDEIIACGFDGIQWINGVGSKPIDDEAWDVIYKKTRDAGLLLQIFCSGKEQLKFIDHLVNLLGSTKGLAFICTGKKEDEDAFISYLDKYNVPR